MTEMSIRCLLAKAVNNYSLYLIIVCIILPWSSFIIPVRKFPNNFDVFVPICHVFLRGRGFTFQYAGNVEEKKGLPPPLLQAKPSNIFFALLVFFSCFAFFFFFGGKEFYVSLQIKPELKHFV